MRSLKIAVVGATGMVGQTFLKILDEMPIEIEALYLYASKRSAGKEIEFQGKTLVVLELKEDNIKDKDIDYALFSAGGSVSLDFAPIFKQYGIRVIDNSSAWRMDDSIPLVVPEINLDDIKDDLIIANPNCSTIQSVLPLKALQNDYQIQGVHYTTYQAVSGSGMKGVEDLKKTQNGQEPSNYKYPIYNNVLPQIDVFLDNGYTKEEMKMVHETHKILHIDVPVSATCVRVPVENSHSVSISLNLDKEMDLVHIRGLLSKFPGVTLVDDIKEDLYPIPTMASGTNDVYVGRLRQDLFHKNVLHMFCVADNIRKGAALNAVQILVALEQRSE
jgi:aspartate-semialdehyde dehydrogenase